MLMIFGVVCGVWGCGAGGGLFHKGGIEDA